MEKVKALISFDFLYIEMPSYDMITEGNSAFGV